MVTGIDEILLKIWPKVRKAHLFPELPTPICVEGGEHVGLDIKQKRISISEEFVISMSQMIEPEDVIEGLLDHAVSHYRYCPWDLANHLKLYGEAKKVLEKKELAERVTDHFMDVVADTYCVKQKDTPLPKLYRYLQGSKVDEVIHGLYQWIWGVDLGVRGSSEEVSRQLARIPYLDRNRWRESIRRFAKVIEPLLEGEEDSGENASGQSAIDQHGLEQYTSDEIEQGLKELALDTDEPADFVKIVEDFEEEILEGTEFLEQNLGLGPGQPLDAEILYYMKLAENFALPILKKPMEKSGSLYPHHHAPWEVGNPYQDVDPWTSFGKIMPGITQRWQRVEGEMFGREEGIPDCMVVIDSSGSMTNPKQHRSDAVVGAACACDAYLRNQARVAVYNFSDVHEECKLILPYTRDRRRIYQALCHYFNGGTRLMMEDIQLLQTDAIPDIFMITDLQIANLEKLVQYFNECKNRVTAIHIGKNKHVETFRSSLRLHKNVAIYQVEKTEDIPRIVLGKVREYLYAEREGEVAAARTFP